MLLNKFFNINTFINNRNKNISVKNLYVSLYYKFNLISIEQQIKNLNSRTFYNLNLFGDLSINKFSDKDSMIINLGIKQSVSYELNNKDFIINVSLSLRSYQFDFFDAIFSIANTFSKSTKSKPTNKEKHESNSNMWNRLI